MSDALSFAEIVGQHVELLPARTVMSLFRLTERTMAVTVAWSARAAPAGVAPA